VSGMNPKPWGDAHIGWTDTSGSCGQHSNIICQSKRDPHVSGGHCWAQCLPPTFPEGRTQPVPLVVRKEEKEKE
jgi:hypothetical protein